MPRKKKSVAESESIPVIVPPAPAESPAAPEPVNVAKPDGRVRYDTDTKARILAAAKGKKLSAAHAAATAVGYTGTAASLYQMLRNAGVKRRKKRAAFIREPDSPAQSAPEPAGIGSIEAAVRAEVEKRVAMAVKAAVAELEKLIS